jgi:hypothetical protein
MNIAIKPSKRAARRDVRRTVEVRSAELHEEIKKADGPILLTRNGRTTGVAVDLKSYRKMMAQIERLETIEGINRGLEDIDQGRYLTLDQFRAHMERRFAVPRSSRGKRRR